MRRFILFAAAIIALSACTQTKWEKTGTGVVVQLNPESGNGAKALKLDLVSERIIHVVASPDGKFA